MEDPLPPVKATTREDVWEALAGQFLDTETRHEIPRAALLCVENGMTCEDAFEAWAYEVTPALYWNVWSVVGEWAGWDRDWLLAQIRRHRTTASRFAYVVYRCRIHLIHACWLAIGRCIDVLRDTAPPEREALVADLTWLANEYFDFRASRPAPSSKERLRALYAGTFLPIFAPLVVKGSASGESRAGCEGRVEAALGQIA